VRLSLSLRRAFSPFLQLVLELELLSAVAKSTTKKTGRLVVCLGFPHLQCGIISFLVLAKRPFIAL